MKRNFLFPVLTLFVLLLGGGTIFLIGKRIIGGSEPGSNAGLAAFARIREETENTLWQFSGEDKGQGTESGQSGANLDEAEQEEAADPAEAPVIRIVLDPGHGGPGTADPQDLGADYRDTYEKYLTLEIAQALGEELAQYGNVEIFYTRESDVRMTLKERAAYAKSVDADLLVSLHLNASEEHNFFGSEVFASAFDVYYAVGEGVGQEILSRLTDCGFVSKGVKTRLGSKGTDYYGIIRECRELGIPAVIVEHGYMDEDGDWSRMNTTEALTRLGEQDAAGIAAYYGLKKGRVLAELPEPELTLPASSPVLPDTTPPEEVWYRIDRQETAYAEVTLHGVERESRVMYYDYSTDGGETYSSLKLWEGGDTIQITCPVTDSEAAGLCFRVYNNYELRTEAVNQ